MQTLELVEAAAGSLRRVEAHLRLLQYRPGDEDLIGRAGREAFLLMGAACSILERVEELEEDLQRGGGARNGSLSG